MDSIRNYLVNLVWAALICSILNCLVEKNSTMKGMVKLLTGIFMAITVLSPVVMLEIGDFSGFLTSVQTDTEGWVESGEEYANEQLRGYISESAEAYILDKAASLGLALQVNVTLCEGGDPIPWTVELKGNASPYAREQLMQYITDMLDIPKERQTWN